MIHGLALCAGAGGLELGLQLALDDGYRCVGYVERDAYAAAALVARMADAALDRAPVWDDLASFDGAAWRGRVDLISAGFPCQPASAAGRRQGQGDERWLWPQIARVVAEVAPAAVFLENVPGLLTVNGGDGMGEILGTLAGLGFDAEWGCFSAAEVGAPQLRERLFILAHAGRWGIERWGVDKHLRGSAPAELSQGLQRERPGHAAGDGGAALADAERPAEAGWGKVGRGAARGGSPGESAGPGAQLVLAYGGGLPEPGAGPAAAPTDGLGAGQPLADADLGGLGVDRPPAFDNFHGIHDPVGCGPFPPGPDERERWAAILGRDPTLEPALRGVADGLAHRVDRLRLSGNGVVPLAAAHAFRALAARLV